MSAWSVILFLLAVLYIAGAIFEFPIMFDGNPKTRYIMAKIGRKNLKILLLACGVVLIVLAAALR